MEMECFVGESHAWLVTVVVFKEGSLMKLFARDTCTLSMFSVYKIENYKIKIIVFQRELSEAPIRSLCSSGTESTQDSYYSDLLTSLFYTR